MTSNDNDNKDDVSDTFSNHEEEGVDATREKSHGHEEEDLRATLARRETRAVRFLRIVVLLLLVSAAIGVSLFAYLYMKHDEETAFQDNFYDLSHRLIREFHANTELRLQTLDSFATSITSTAKATNQTWPFVTIPDFEARATAARVSAASVLLSMYPAVFVTEDAPDVRAEFEAYAQTHAEWVEESFDYQKAFIAMHNRTIGGKGIRALSTFALEEASPQGSRRRTQNQEPPAKLVDRDDRGMAKQIFRIATEEEGLDWDTGFIFVVENTDGPYYPVWQTSPARPQVYEDLLFDLNHPTSGPPEWVAAVDLVRTSEMAILAPAWNVDEEGAIPEDDDFDTRSVPVATLFYPIFDKILSDNLRERKVAALVELDVEFGPLLSAGLPSESKPLTCVLRNTCSQTFSFEVAGETASYLGWGDWHDPKYDSMMVESLLNDVHNDEIHSSSSGRYNGVPLNSGYCPWTVTVYATKEMEDAFVTSKPAYYMCAVLGIFLFTCAVFLIYDRIVEHRQRKVMTTAVNSDKIVSSLFPHKVRERLYEEKKEQARQSTLEQPGSVQGFLSTTAGKYTNQQPSQNTPPIAELYQNCTVFFADISGFTQWSASRSPIEVFTLLETLYGAFDSHAKRCKVFKVETIGDCYLAVTGLPVAQPNHAVIMVRFAKLCQDTMRKLLGELSEKLGDDTKELAMRVGLHSGPVTAGVLRGDKARFQLFGDTVNTASRMESNGLRDRIHCSQETANLLIEAGKEQWIRERDEKIDAKGKGTMQTYWVLPSGTGTMSSSMSVSSLPSPDEFDDSAVAEA